MRYLSVCSGIEAATQAWHPLGWQCAGVSEIEPFPRAVLEQRLGAVAVDDDHRWHPGSNTVPLFGDFTKIEAHHVGPIDLLVGGTPCQSFSIAGKRLGLDDPRGNLTLEFLALARRVRPRWIVWENVPGVLSHDEGRTMGTFLRLVGECGFRWAYRVLDAQYVRVGRFGRAVPQRRRRVFLVGYSGTGEFDPRAVLFDRESLRGNPAPRRQAGEGVAPTIAARTRGCGGLGTDFDCDGGLIANSGDISYCIASSGQASNDAETETLIAHALRGEGLDASEDGTGRGTPIIPIDMRQASRGDKMTNNRAEGSTGGAPGTGIGNIGDPSPTIGTSHIPAIAFSAKDYGADAMEDCSPTLRAGGHTGSHANAGVMPAIAFDMRGREGGAMPEGPHDTANIRAASGGSSRSYVAFAQNSRDEVRIQGDGQVSGALAADEGMKQRTYLAASWGVRRLTPRECERLQAFPDDFTRIEWRGKPADQCPDGPRYKALGNSMAVNVMSWIGERIAAVEAIQQKREAA